MNSLLGKKVGMTQVFTEDGRKVSVSVIEAGPCAVLAVKEKSLQVGFDQAKEGSLKKPQAGLFKKCNVSPRKFVRELVKTAGDYKVGDELKVDIFKPGDYVDVTGTSKGKGFQGGMKRWHWAGGPETHGSTSHRRVGSIGSTTTPGRVLKGHHMPGHMGDERVTTQNVLVVKVMPEQNLLVVKGSIPGAAAGYVIVKKAVKKS